MRKKASKKSKSGKGWPILCLASQLAIEHSMAPGINARLQISLEISRALSFAALDITIFLSIKNTSKTHP